MRAIVLQAPGGPEVLQVQERPLPAPGPGEVRVRAHAIGVGRPDALIRTGRYKWMPPLPAVPGNELAGVVDALGAGVTDLRLGQHVLLSSRELPQRGGCYAEYVCVSAPALYALPEGIAFDDAVSLPNFQLAHALLFHCQGARAPQSVLLTAASGGVACAMVQLARDAGMRVFTTASTPAKRDFTLDMGAHQAFNPRSPTWVEALREATGGRGVDLAIDPVGAALFLQCLECLAPLGCAVSYNIMGGMPSGDVFAALRKHLGRSLGVRVFSMHTFDADPALRRKLMTDSIEALASGRVRAPAATVLPLAEAGRAHQMLDAPDTLGKIVLHP